MAKDLRNDRPEQEAISLGAGGAADRLTWPEERRPGAADHGGIQPLLE